MQSRDPILEMVHAERFVNDGSPTGLTWKRSSSPATCPRRSGAQFLLPLLSMSSATVELRGVLPDVFRRNDEVLFPIHPDCVHLIDRGLHRRIVSSAEAAWPVSPTASPRTVYLRRDTWQGFVKLDYPFVLGRFSRELAGTKLFQGVHVSEMLRTQNADDYGILHFPEIAAFEIALSESRRGGALIREAVPTGPIHDRYVAFCSLFGSDYFDLASEPVVVQLARQYGGASWVAERVLVPLIRSFWGLIFRFAVWPEPHAQNIVLGVSDDGSTSIVWRDCQGFCAEPEAAPDLRNHLHRVLIGRDGVERRSYLYDTLLSTYVLDPLIAAVEGAFPSTGRGLRAAVIEETRAALARQGATNLLPVDESYVMSLEPPADRHLPFVVCPHVRYR